MLRSTTKLFVLHLLKFATTVTASVLQIKVVDGLDGVLHKSEGGQKSNDIMGAEDSLKSHAETPPCSCIGIVSKSDKFASYVSR